LRQRLEQVSRLAHAGAFRRRARQRFRALCPPPTPAQHTLGVPG
jgi:hypothetical protein